MIDRYATESIAFIETGTNVGSTLAYMAGKYPFMKCLSCEPSLKAFVRAIENTDNLENVRLFNEDSDIFMRRIESYYKYLFKGPVLFWLDAHGQGSSWPLKSEVRLISIVDISSSMISWYQVNRCSTMIVMVDMPVRLIISETVLKAGIT